MSINLDIEIERELGARSLRQFLAMAWHQVEPDRPFVSNWHHDVICEHLEAVSRREITRLVINVPPGTTKTLVTSVMWPAWSWINNPAEKWITASYSDHIARRDCLRARQMLESRWYQERWGSRWKKNPHRWTSTEYRNDRAGFRFAVTVGGGVTGEHADIQLVDDPVKPLDARGLRVDTTALETCRIWWDETMATRMSDPNNAARVIIMQRLHEQDLSGHVLRSGHYTHLNLPMRYEGKCVVTVSHPCSATETDRGDALDATQLGYKDCRSEGELLWPARFPEEIQAVRKEELGSRGVAAQDQQRPTPAGGGIFKRDWIQYWRAFPKGPGCQMILSWDCSFKGLKESDRVCGQVWVRKDAQYYLVDQVCDRMSFTATVKAFAAQCAKWPKAVRKLVEDKANGTAVLNVLEKRIPGLIPVNPKGGKVARAHAVEPLWEAGNVFIPDPSLSGYDWVSDFVEELVGFSGDAGREDDCVDAMTQALSDLYDSTADNYIAAMRAVMQNL